MPIVEPDPPPVPVTSVASGSGIAEPTVLDLHQYSLRHIGPKAVVFPDTPGASFTVLNRTDLVARPLPQANIPNSADFVSGSWTGRLFDAGDGKLVFPNKEASDGVPWRLRFDPTNKLQWVEIWVDEYLESVLCVTKVTPDRNQILVEGYDGVQMLKSAYTRDWVCVKAPRDVIKRGTQVWIPTTSDDFAAGEVFPNQQVTSHAFGSGSSVILGASGGCILNPGASSGAAYVTSNHLTSLTATGTWSASCSVQAAGLTDLFNAGGQFLFQIRESSGDYYQIDFNTSTTGFAFVTSLTANMVASVDPPLTTTVTLGIESDGEWVSAFVNGQLVGMSRRLHATTTTLTIQAGINNGGGTTTPVTLLYVLGEALQPFLMRDNMDQGDFVLPGTAATYPSVGLHARYYNDADLASDTNRLVKILAPLRSAAYGSQIEYINQQDPQVAYQVNPTPGAAQSNWSVKWFGAIYLKLSAGDYDIQISTPGGGNSAVRLWVGKTQFGDQIIDQWAWAVGGPFRVTLTAASLGSKDGWYPLVLEYAVDGSIITAPELIFNAPAVYTDPGGTSIPTSDVVVPATSLSPLGCIDQRYQGASHYDLTTKTAIAVGYQMALEPKQLESGLFPGVFAPRLREGTSYDTILEPDDTQRKEGIINYSASVDGTDQASSITGNGAGFQNGNTGQLQASVFDAATLQDALFDMQAWQDSADAAFASLLQALLNSQLGLRLQPWELVTGDPIARDREAFTWPLPGILSNLRWRPGDALRVVARDINVQDTTPRQLLLVTRNIHPNGTTSTQVGFAARPKTGVYAIRQAIAASLRPQRNYQRQLVGLQGSYQATAALGAGSTDSSSSIVTLSQGDRLITATLHIIQNSAAQVLSVFVNGVDETATLNGPWSVVPVILNIAAVAAPDALNRLYVQIHNGGGSATDVSYQLQVSVLR